MSVNDFGDFGTCTFMCNANYSEEIIMLQLCFAFLFFHKLQVIHMYASYRFLTYWTRGVLGRGVRKVITACAVVAKRNLPSHQRMDDTKVSGMVMMVWK